MYIVVIAWLYVTLLMALTEQSLTAGVLTFLFYGLLPCALFVWIFGTPQRRRNRLKALQQTAQPTGQPSSSLEPKLDQADRRDTERN